MIGMALGFLGSGAGRMLMLVFALLAWTAWNRHDAASAAWAKAEVACQEQVAERTAAEIARQNKAASTALQAALTRASEMEQDRNGLRERVASLVADLRKDEAPGCRVSDDLLRELQSIR